MIAITTQIRKIFPTVSPSTSRTTNWRPPTPISGAVDVGDREDREQQDAAAEDERGDHRPHDRQRRGLARLPGLLAERARGVEAVHDVGRGQRGGEEGAEVAPVVALAEALGLEEDVGAAGDVRREQDDQQDRGDQLDEHAGAVDPRHQLHPEGVDDGREDDQDRAQDHGVGGEVVLAGAVADELERAIDLRQGDLVGERHGGDRDDRSGEHHPAPEPGDRRARKLLAPVVDRPGDRVVGGELGEAERHHHLAEEDHRPRPPVGGAAEGEAEVEELEGAGEDRDVADPGGEARELADAAVELLLVAELGELVRLGLGSSSFRRHTRPPSWASPARLASWTLRACAARQSLSGAGAVKSDISGLSRLHHARQRHRRDRDRRVPPAPPAVRQPRRGGAGRRRGRRRGRVATPRRRRSSTAPGPPPSPPTSSGAARSSC